MLKGIDINQRIEFVSKYDKEKEKTVFVFRPLTGIEMINISSSVSVEEMLCKSIVEIKNFGDNKEVADAINSLPAKVISELLIEFNKINNITEEDEKN